MTYCILIIITTLITVLLIPFLDSKQKGNVAVLGVLINSIISSVIAIQVLLGQTFEYSFYGGFIFGSIILKVDALSAWFILLMNFTSITAILYGVQYLKVYQNQRARLSMHYGSFLLNHFAMIGIYFLHNLLAFLCVWELMAISAFLLVIFEHHKMETIKAGMNYLIQSHVSVVFIMLGIIWVSFNTGSFVFSAISQYSLSVSNPISFLLFLCFFAGFAIKAGFVPFHTWLPHAHPAAPAHISGLMSGVIIKLGIYGILRMLLLINANFLIIGIFILIISVISGVYGVMLAILQHNLKRLLAYHSIENIGIIGIGIGIGCIGKGIGNDFLQFAGFAGALLHTLNHSLFKSLLFYAAGTVYQAVHTVQIEQLGGLIKKMPHTAILFLIGSLAICGLPPFNGFVSEFLIYSGLFGAINNNQLSFTILIISSIFGLVLIGGLALFCFTKAFGIVFLGTARNHHPHNYEEPGTATLFPKYMIVVFILVIGLLPQLFIRVINGPVSMFQDESGLNQSLPKLINTMQMVSLASTAILIFAFGVYFIKKQFTRKAVINFSPTWGCGYDVVSPKLQYTAGSYARSFEKLVKPIINIHKHEGRINTIVPHPVGFASHVSDKIETNLISTPIMHLRGFVGKFTFLQNGSVQFYVLYGVVFILIAITIPFLINSAFFIFELFKQL